jgi:hypothetical protein
VTVDVLELVLRILHIGSGIFWVGTAWFFFGFIEPTTQALGPAAGPFMHHVVSQRRIVPAVLGAATLNVVMGLILYWRSSGGLDQAWLKSGVGIGFTFGGLCALAAWVLAVRMIGPTIVKLDEAGSAMAGAGRPPTPEELGRMGALAHRLHRIGQADVILLLGAVLGMATARYLTF